MNVKFFRDGKEITIEELGVDFSRDYFKDNIFGQLLMQTLELAHDALKNSREQEEKAQPELLLKDEPNLFEKLEDKVTESPVPECSGDPDNCPLCGSEVNVTFSEALAALKEGKHVIRKSWIGVGLDVDYLYLSQESDDYYSAFYISDLEGKDYVYTFQHDDLTAEDWLIEN